MSDQQRSIPPKVASTSANVASTTYQSASAAGSPRGLPVGLPTGGRPGISRDVSNMSIENRDGLPHRPTVPESIMAGGSANINGFLTDQGQKSSNMSASGQPVTMPNGNQMVHGRAPSIKFGTHNADGSPAVTYNQLAQSSSVAGLTANSITPIVSQSPIIQPATSGGRPPSALPIPANGVNFGSMQGEISENLPTGGMMPSHIHNRRDSAASMQSEMSSSSHPQNRTYSHQGRARGHPGNFHNQGYQGHQNYGNGHRQNGSRGIHPSYGQQANRGSQSPAPSQVMPNQVHMQGAYPHPHPQMAYTLFDPTYQWYPSPMPIPYGASVPTHLPQRAPSSSFNPMISQYPNQSAMPTSRTSSRMSEHRPTSSLAYSVPASSLNTNPTSIPSQHNAKPGPLPNFKIPPKSKGLIIKDPNTGKEIAKPTKQSVTPSAGPEHRSPPAKSATSTPEPASSLRPRADSTAKSAQEKMDEMKAAVQRKVKEGSGDTQTDSKNLDMAWAIPGTDTEAPSKDDEGSSQATTSTEESDEVEQPIPNAASQSESVERIGKAEQSVPDAGSQSESPTETEEERIEREIREIEENEQLENEKQQRYEAERAKRLVQEKADYAKSDAGIAEARALKDAEAEAEQIEEARAAKAEKEQAQEDAHQSAEALAESERAEGDDAVSREKSVEGSGLNTPAESEVSQSATAASLVSGLRRLVSSQGTGTSTPASDDSMGPVKSAMKKPISLARLQTAGPTTPSAQQLALQSAQLVRDISSIEYPKDVKPPESVGDSTTDIVLHRYDTDFLLQFRIVCTSKPSLDWDKRLKEAMGEGSDSARTPSNRSGHPTSSRQPSHRGNNPFQGGAMGSFGQPSAPGPRGTTSEERFAMSNRPAPRSGMGTPGVSFAAMPRGGSGSGPVSRNPSTASFGMGAGITPPSPRRTQAGRHDSNKNPSRGGRKHDGGDAKSMPLTVGQEFKPLAPSASGWKPRSVGAAAQMAGPTPGDNKILQPDEVQRKVKSNLNKMTPENFEKISGQILEIAAQSKHEADGRTLRQVIQLTFEKATDEAHWAPMYAQFALKMLQLVDSGIQDAGVTDKEGKPLKGGPLFRKYLLNRCQEEFEVGRKVDDSGKTPGQSDEAVMLSDEYYIAAAAKRRSLGLVRFIGEMFKLSMLSSRIMHECLTRLLEFENLPDEAEIEGLCNLLKTVGYALDDDKGKTRMDQYFQRIQNVMNMPELPSRLHYMLLDIVDLRRKRWHGKDVNKGPKTLQEIHEEAEIQAREKEAERFRQNTQKRNTRGDGRYQGQGGFSQPPPMDHSRTTVTMADLKGLSKSRPQNQSSTSFGPSTMLGGRNNSRRGTPGMSGLGIRQDSGSGRAGTPPMKLDKDETPTSNKYSALGESTSPRAQELAGTKKAENS